MKIATCREYPKYEISDTGIVFSKNYKHTGERRELVSVKTTRGYLCVTVYEGTVRKVVYVHQLVAKAFITNPLKRREVNHKNGNKHDNTVENLEWVTASENMLHAVRVLNRKPPEHATNREKNPTNRKVIQMDMSGNYIASHLSLTLAAEKIGRNRSNIGSAIRGSRNHCGGYKWRYA